MYQQVNIQYIENNPLFLPNEIHLYIFVLHKLEEKFIYGILEIIFLPSTLASANTLIGQEIFCLTPGGVGGQQAIRSKNAGQYESKHINQIHRSLIHPDVYH